MKVKVYNKIKGPTKAKGLIPFDLNPHFETLNSNHLGWDFPHMGLKGPRYHLLSLGL